MPSSVSINYITNDEGRLSDFNGGALQILIGAVRLNKNINEEEIEENGNNSPIYSKEYAGDFLYGDLYNILETTADIVKDPTIYEKNRVQFEGYDNYLVLEYLGDDKLRIAYRINPDREDESFNFCAVPKSARGYIVELEDWKNELKNTVESFQEELRENEENEWVDWFNSELKTLQ